MTITLLNFPDRNNSLFTIGESVSGTVRFTAKETGDYTALGCQLIVDADNGVKVIHAIRVDSSTYFTAGETREYPVSFTVPDHPSYRGKLFIIRSGVRGYAVPAKKQSAALRQVASYYPTSTPWYYQLKPQRFQVNQAVNIELVPKGCAPDVLFLLALPFIVALVGLGGWGILAIIFGVVGLGYYSLVREENNTGITKPTVKIETQGQALLVRVLFSSPPKKGTRLTAGYEVRERQCYVNQGEEHITYEPVKLKEPQQKLVLNDRGEGIAEHQFLPLPPPKMWGDIGFEWVYQVTATLPDGKVDKWGGLITLKK